MGDLVDGFVGRRNDLVETRRTRQRRPGEAGALFAISPSSYRTAYGWPAHRSKARRATNTGTYSSTAAATTAEHGRRRPFWNWTQQFQGTRGHPAHALGIGAGNRPHARTQQQRPHLPERLERLRKILVSALPTDMPNNNSGIDLIKLPDGVLVLQRIQSGRRRCGSRSLLNLAVSFDNGKTWPKDNRARKRQSAGGYSYRRLSPTETVWRSLTSWNRQRIVFGSSQTVMLWRPDNHLPMKKLLLSALLLLTGSLFANERIARLRCEEMTDPIGIDVLQPRLSWELESDRRGVLQTAYGSSSLRTRLCSTATRATCGIRERSKATRRRG